MLPCQRLRLCLIGRFAEHKYNKNKQLPPSLGRARAPMKYKTELFFVRLVTMKSSVLF